MPRIDIIIPVYNEGENIIRVLNAFERHVTTPIRVLICYDTEEDTTLPALQAHPVDRYGFEVVLVKNQGERVHGAVLTGFKYSDAPAVISYMADDDYNAGNIDLMIDTFHQGNDVVCASRFIPGGNMIGCRWQKATLVRAVSFTLRQFARLPAHDATNAFRLFSRRLLDCVSIESKVGFTYSIELLVKCHRLGWSIAETPAQWYERSHGTSRFKILDWAPDYLQWYFYAFGTTYFRQRTL